MMLKPWTWLLLAGFGWCAFFVGIIFGDVGHTNPAYTTGLGTVLVGIVVTFVPLVIGIHTGVSFMREEKKGDL
jgi:hypothetical protein